MTKGNRGAQSYPRVIEHEIESATLATVIRADEKNEANGGASHSYVVEIGENNGAPPEVAYYIPSFQDGPVKDVGSNGITNEALIAIVIDRLQCFNESKWRCRENSLAITHLEEALHWLTSRTTKRLKRLVEGTHQV